MDALTLLYSYCPQGWNSAAWNPWTAVQWHKPCLGSSPQHFSRTCNTWCCCRTVPLQALCLSTTSAFPRYTMIPGDWCPWNQQASLPEQNKWWGEQCGVFIQTSQGRMRFPPAWDHQYYYFVPTPCSLLKLPASNPAVYFRKCQAVSLWLFMASNVFPFTAYFRCNKREMKGPLKENALPWHYLLCGMFPELLLNECCLYPCTICLVTYRMLFLLAGVHFWAGFSPLQPAVQREEMLEPVAGGSCSQSAAAALGISAPPLSQASRSQPLLKSLARCCSSLGFPCCY